MKNGQPGKRHSILVCDDEENVRESFSLILKDEFEVMQARDGAELLEKIKSHPPDLIILDLKMPGMSGPEALKQIRHANRSIPVIITSAYKLPEEVKNLGISGFIEKPFESKAVLKLVKEVLEAKK